MLIKTIPVGHLETNCYIVTDENTLGCAVIDPGDESNTIMDYLEDNHLSCKAILLTHGHYDHTGAVVAVAEEAGVCLVRGPPLFTPDPLSQGSCGPVDLPGGSAKDEMQSLRRLCALPGDYEVYPGHMDSTTLERERNFNYYCREASK